MLAGRQANGKRKHESDQLDGEYEELRLEQQQLKADILKKQQRFSEAERKMSNNRRSVRVRLESQSLVCRRISNPN